MRRRHVRVRPPKRAVTVEDRSAEVLPATSGAGGSDDGDHRGPPVPAITVPRPDSAMPPSDLAFDAKTGGCAETVLTWGRKNHESRRRPTACLDYQEQTGSEKNGCCRPLGAHLGADQPANEHRRSVQFFQRRNP